MLYDTDEWAPIVSELPFPANSAIKLYVEMIIFKTLPPTGTTGLSERRKGVDGGGQLKGLEGGGGTESNLIYSSLVVKQSCFMFIDWKASPGILRKTLVGFQ